MFALGRCFPKMSLEAKKWPQRAKVEMFFKEKLLKGRKTIKYSQLLISRIVAD